jgi:hypothetical protein
MTTMPSRRRPKAPPPVPLSDAERFAKSLRDSEEADRKAKQDVIDLKAEAERLKLEAAEQAARLQRAQAAHQRAVEMVKEAKRTGKGAAAADIAWREAKAELLELETGKRPAWAARPPEPTESVESGDATQSETLDEVEAEVDVEIDGD